MIPICSGLIAFASSSLVTMVKTTSERLIATRLPSYRAAIGRATAEPYTASILSLVKYTFSGVTTFISFLARISSPNIKYTSTVPTLRPVNTPSAVIAPHFSSETVHVQPSGISVILPVALIPTAVNCTGVPTVE